MTVYIYLKSRSVIKLTGIASLKTSTDYKTGQFTGYEIKWEEGKALKAFSINLPQIEAFVSEDKE